MLAAARQQTAAGNAAHGAICAYLKRPRHARCNVKVGADVVDDCTPQLGLLLLLLLLASARRAAGLLLLLLLLLFGRLFCLRWRNGASKPPCLPLAWLLRSRLRLHWLLLLLGRSLLLLHLLSTCRLRRIICGGSLLLWLLRLHGRGQVGIVPAFHTVVTVMLVVLLLLLLLLLCWTVCRAAGLPLCSLRRWCVPSWRAPVLLITA